MACRAMTRAVLCALSSAIAVPRHDPPRLRRAVCLKLSYCRAAPSPNFITQTCWDTLDLRHIVICTASFDVLFLDTFMLAMEMIKSKAFWDTRYPQIWWIVINF